MRNLSLKDKLLPVRNCERYKMLSCDSVINIDKRNMTGPETSDYNYGTKHSSLELQWLPVHSNFMQKKSNLYVGQSSSLKSIFRNELIIRHAEIFWEPPP